MRFLADGAFAQLTMPAVSASFGNGVLFRLADPIGNVGPRAVAQIREILADLLDQ